MSHKTPKHDSLDDHPGLDNDESTAEGKMMTAEGSTGETSETGAIRRSRIIPGSTTTRRWKKAR